MSWRGTRPAESSSQNGARRQTAPSVKDVHEKGSWRGGLYFGVKWVTGQECVPQTLHSRDEESHAACNGALSRSPAILRRYYDMRIEVYGMRGSDQ
jgi:hypothetical protein